MKDKKQVAVVIPIYKATLTDLEKISLAQCFRILSPYPIIAVKPNSLDISAISGSELFSEIYSFKNSFFHGIKGYNELMLSPVFYERFLDFEFILIYQLDAFVFRDELAVWCNKGYDYIGAPWLKFPASPDFIKAAKTRIKTYYYTFFNIYRNGLPCERQFDNMVGNGGFSLRRVSKFHYLSIKFKAKIDEYHQREEHQFNEDVFWSLEMNRKFNRLNIPGFKEALLFAFENRVELSMFHTKNKIPFGCHAWDLHPDFWRPYIEEFGYKIPFPVQSN